MKRDELKINEPCTENWDAMDGQGETRFCDKCTKNVHNLSEMSREEATEFMANNAENNVCVIYKFDTRSGDVRFKEKPRKPSLRQLMGLKKLVAAAALVVPLAAGCDTSVDTCPDEDGIRPIDLIMEQERHLSEYLESLFSIEPAPIVMGEAVYEPEPEPMLMGKIAYEPEFVPAPPEPETVVEVMGDVEWEPERVEPVEHQIRKDLDNSLEIPIDRVMGRIAPVRVQEDISDVEWE